MPEIGRLLSDKLWFYPHYTGNGYQDLIYEPLTHQGCDLQRIKSAEVATLQALPSMDDQSIVLHIRLLNALFKGIDSTDYERRV